MSEEVFDGQANAQEQDSRGQWFVVHTLSGHENKVRDTILRQIRMGDSVAVYDAYIPIEMVSEVRNGKKQIKKKKIFPGYILVRMDLYGENGAVDEKAWYFVRNVQGVLGFLGSENKPQPLSPGEAADLLRPAAAENLDVKPKIEFLVGDIVRINNGPFEGCEGKVLETDGDRGRLKVDVTVFGRSTPVELEFWQVERAV